MGNRIKDHSRPDHPSGADMACPLACWANNGLVLALLLLSTVFSVITWKDQHPTDSYAAARLARAILEQHGSRPSVLIAVRDNDNDRAFAQTLQETLEQGGGHVVKVVQGSPGDARNALHGNCATWGQPLQVVACNVVTARWGVFQNLREQYPQLGQPHVMVPVSYRWPIS